nr:glucuronate isomerase [uncultured Allomuricauda sp.]
MGQIQSKIFITDNFLLNSKEAETLYHQHAKQMPIIDYHNHLSPQEIAEDKPIGNITKAWLSGDHYKWRGMRANGVEEKYITGDASLEDKFVKWAETVPYTLRNPLFHWTQLELKRYFDVDTILQSSSAKEIYGEANQILASKTPAQLLEEMNVEVVCTTDDPTDDLKYHKQIAEKGFFTKVFPTFRSDNLFLIGQSEFPDYVKKLESTVSHDIKDLSTFLEAIDQRLAHFHNHGCRLSDFGIGDALAMEEFTLEEVREIFEKASKRGVLSTIEINKYRTCVFLHLSRKYHEMNWVQQFHLGPIRNNNSRLRKEIGADVGCDSIGEYPMASFLSKLFDSLDATNQLAKTITYNLNPSQNEVFATMMGNYSEAGVPGKMQWGSGWWFLDQKDGMEKQLNTLSNMGLLSRFVGMLTDSRSFLSFPRHEYFRRILCNLIAQDAIDGLVPHDIPFLGKMIQDICYNNASNYFDFKNV